MTNSAKIRTSVCERRIPHLLHFTPTENLASIAAYGIRPRRTLQGLTYRPSAEGRLDGRSDAISVSITRLNTWMFASKRKSSRVRDWTVLMLSPSILWTHSCWFCWTNAASNEIAKKRFLGGPWAFDEMFRRSTPESYSLPEACPTHSDAEVQILEPIAPTLIIGVVVDRHHKVGPTRRVLEGLSVDQLRIFVEDFPSY
jgi:hypothetical protein